MGQVIASASMSVDGYIAKHDNSIGDIAGDRTVAVTAGSIARQCLELGLLDAVAVDLVRVVMGDGRPYFGALSLEDALLGDPTITIQGDRVTHLMFPVTKQEGSER